MTRIMNNDSNNRITRNWVVAIPHHIPWSQMEEEYKDAENDSSITLNYKISYKPKCKPGDKLFILHRKKVKGYHVIDNIIDDKKGFKCNTTGQEWPPGIYIQRSGKFHEIKPVNMTGFRGIRPFKYSDKDINMSYDIILSNTNRSDGGNIMESEKDTIIVGEHDDEAQKDEGKITEQNDSQTFDGITVIPWDQVGQFMGGKNGLTVVSPKAMEKYPSSAKNSIQPGMTAEDGLFDLSKLEGIMNSAATFEKTLAEKDAKIAELEKQISDSSDNTEHQCPEGQEWDPEKNACVMIKKEEDEQQEEEEKTDAQKAKDKEEQDSAKSKTVEDEKGESGKEEAEHEADDDIKKVTFMMKQAKDNGKL